MQDFLKGIKNLGTKAKSTIKDFFTVTPEEEAKGKKPNVVEKTTKTMGDFFAPKADTVRVRDVAREIPGATANVAKEIAKGVTRFALSAGESVADVPLGINELINPGTKYKVPIYEPEKIPGLGFLGPIESYQNQAKREMSKGESGGIKSFLKTAGNIAVDEPVGVAFKPLGLAVGAFIKGGGGKAIEESIDALAKSNAPEEITKLLGSLGIGKKASSELVEPLAKASTVDEVKAILGYTDNVAPKAEKKAVEGASRETAPVVKDPVKRAESYGFDSFADDMGGPDGAKDFAKQFWAKPGKDGTYYHVTEGDTPFTAFDKTQARNYDPKLRNGGISMINGLYIGKDKNALKSFYGMDKDVQVLTFKGEPKLLDLMNRTDEEKFIADVMKKYGVKSRTSAKLGEAMEKEIAAQGYDGARYFDPYATGEEIVITNTKAFDKAAPVARETAPITEGFDKDKFFQGQVSKFKTHDNYMQNKYNGFAKASGLDKAGIDDETIKWVDDWLYAKPSVPSENVVKQLEAYKPKKPTTLYSGNSIDQLNINRTDPTSFTADLDVAKQFGDAGRRDNPAIIRIENVKPEDIAVSIDDLPKNMLKALGHDTSFAAAEREMVTGKTLADFSKKYNVSISKDGGKTWESLATTKTPAKKAVARETKAIEPDLVVEAHVARSPEEFSTIAKRMYPDMADDELKAVYDDVKRWEETPVLKSLADYKLGVTGQDSIENASRDFMDAIKKDPKTAKEIAESSRATLKEEGVTKLYRYGDKEGLSWTTKPDEYFAQGRPLQEIEVTPEIMKRVAYAEGAEVKAGYQAFPNTGEGEVILMPGKTVARATPESKATAKAVSRETMNPASKLILEDDAYKGHAKERGVEKKGISDATYEWFDHWQQPEMYDSIVKTPAPEIAEELSKFRPTKPITLYRGVSGKTDGANLVGYESWTKDKEVAQNFAGKKGKVIKQTFTPDQILYDMDKLPKGMLDINGNIEKEVVVRAGNVARETPESVDSMRSIGDILKGKGGDIVPPVKPTAKGGKAPKGDPERRFITRTREMAPEVDELLEGKYKPKSNKELIANAEKMIADDYAGAEKLARTGTDDQAVAIANKLIEDELNIARKATDEATKNKAYALAAEIANDAAKNLTEAGRAVQAASLLGKMTPEGMARYAARQIQKYNEQAGARTVKNFLGGAKKIPELTGDQLKEITDAMEVINKMEDGTDKARALQKLGEKIQSYIPSTLYQKVINVWKAGLLTGLKTTGVNIASNLSHSISEIAKDVPASAVDAIVSLFTGKRTLALTGKGAGKGAAEGVAKGWDYLKTGFDERNIADKLDYKKVNFGKGPVAKALKGYTDTVFGLLGAEDQPFYYAAKMRSLANQASAMAKNEGLKGKAARDFAQKLIENPTDDMMKYATLDAETAVFQQDSWLAKKAQNLQKGLEIILPFAKTPANVANAMINYSPVGIVKTIIENIGKGRFDQRLFSQGMGRGITGTGALAIGSALMANKMMNLTTPSSEKEREQWELEGRVPNSILIGGKWRNIGVLGPLGMVLIVGGHLREGIDKTGSFAGGLAQSAAGFGSALTEQSFLSGVNRAIDAIKDPNRSFEGFASSLAGSIIPTLIADIARGTDQYERRPDGMIERIQSRIPGARQGLEPKIDAFGQPVETPNFFEVMADATRPGNPTADPKDPVLVELRRLMDADYGVTPTQLGPNSGYKSLTPEQNSFMWKLAGQAAKAETERVMQSKQYKNYDDEQKSQVIDAAIQDAKTEARARTVVQALKGLSDAEQKSKLAAMKEDGLLTRSVFDLYLSLKRKQ